MKRTILMFLSALFTLSAWSQSSDERLQQLLQDYPEPLQTLIAADAAVQEAALEAATQPEVLARLQKIQDRSRAAFDAIVQPYSQETQQIFWDLARYPNLVARLAREGRGTESGVQNVLRDYPTAIHARAKEASKYYYNLLVKMDDLQKQTDDEFSNLLQSYPRRTQDVFRKLIDQPEALSALTQDRRLTEELSDLYRRDSNGTLRRFQTLNREMAEQNNSQLQDWKSELENDPEAVNEFSESAQAYAKEYGYDDEYYGEDFEEDNYNDNSRQRRVVVRDYYNYHYPYWFGYPRWYRQARWRPVPVWYDYGFRYRPGRPIIVVQMPSFRFVNWYFYRPYNHYRYARLSSCFVNYSYRYPRSYNNIVVNVNVWKYRNRDLVGDNWLSNRNNRVERLREFGRMEQERVEYNRSNRSREVTQRDYLEKNEVKYPRLREVAPARTAARENVSERSVESPRPSTATNQPRTRAEAHERARQTPERTESNPEIVRENPRRSENTTQPRTRENIPTRETPNQTETDNAPRRTERTPQPRTRENVETRETPNRTETDNGPRRREVEQPRREPIRREENRTIERNPAPETPRRETQARPREQVRERSEQPREPRSVERPRSNDSQERSKSEPRKNESAPRSRNGNDN